MGGGGGNGGGGARWDDPESCLHPQKRVVVVNRLQAVILYDWQLFEASLKEEKKRMHGWPGSLQ